MINASITVRNIREYFTRPSTAVSQPEAPADTITYSSDGEKKAAKEFEGGSCSVLTRYGIGALSGMACGAALTLGGVPAVVAMAGMAIGLAIAMPTSEPYGIAADNAIPAAVITGVSAGAIRGAALIIGGGAVTGAIAGGVIATGLVKLCNWLSGE